MKPQRGNDAHNPVNVCNFMSCCVLPNLPNHPCDRGKKNVTALERKQINTTPKEYVLQKRGYSSYYQRSEFLISDGGNK